jgi:Ni,Fe-hydrogenase III component G
MTNEENIKRDIETKFSNLAGAVIIKRDRRIFLDVPLEQWTAVFDYLVKDMKFSMLSAITGLDEGNTLGAIYHLSRDGGMMLSLRTHLPKGNPVINTVTPYFPSADVYERELEDLLGIKVAGLAEGHRYPLADDWPRDAYPLRKDWKGKTNA